MIRITQTYLINLGIIHFQTKGWTPLYKDVPGGKRSGTGEIARINSVWERLYNLSPDILFKKNSNILIVEVDKALNDSYIEKYKKYTSKKAELINEIEKAINKKILDVYFGFVAQVYKPFDKIGVPSSPFYYLYYNKQEDKLHEALLNISGK